MKYCRDMYGKQMPNDKIDEARVDEGCQLVVYKHSNYKSLTEIIYPTSTWVTL